jgi:hypothetical protein
MTLLELLVALTILALLSATILSSIGPWLQQGRLRMDEARFWRAAAPTQILLSEIAAGAIGDASARSITSHRVALRTYTPRLLPAPLDVTLSIETRGATSRLLLEAPALGESAVVLDQAPALRFAERFDRLQLESERHGSWSPVVVAPLSTNASFVCSFDAISRACR